jgi:hypothetical protein
MASLSSHLHAVDGHAWLPFHPDCPMCRDERLVGTLSSAGPTSTRAQAAVAASVLVFGATAPVAVAAESDSEQDGTAAVTQTASGDSSVDFDPGGASDDLPAQAPALPETAAAPVAGNDDTAGIDQQPKTNTDDPVVDQGDGSVTASTTSQAPTEAAPPDGTSAPASDQTAAQQSAAPAAQTTTAAPEATPPAATPSPEPAPSTSAADVAQPNAARSAPKVRGRRHRRHAERRSIRLVVHHTQIATARTAATTTTTAPAAPATAAESAVPTSVPAVGRAKPGDRTHIVGAGESLWSIASDLLGRDASPARVAREVHRLWQLNRSRIATGSPDLLMVGTTLRLR